MGRRPLCLAALLFVFWILCTQVGNLEEKGGGLEARLTESGESRRIRVRGEVYRQEKKKTNQIYLKNARGIPGNLTWRSGISLKKSEC